MTDLKEYPRPLLKKQHPRASDKVPILAGSNYPLIEINFKEKIWDSLYKRMDKEKALCRSSLAPSCKPPPNKGFLTYPLSLIPDRA